MNKYYIKVFISFILIFLVLFGLRVEASLPLAGKLIILDSGHGGADPGTMYKEIYEKDINLKITLFLEEELSKRGAGVLLIRDGDYDLSGGVKTHRKKTDFDNRIKLINNSEADMYLSIHLNYLTNSAYYGAQVFYNKDNEGIAKKIQEYMNSHLDTKREIKKIPTSTYMYDKLTTSGVLIECGFLSNYKERSLLVTEEYQKKLAVVIADAIVNYYK